MRVISVPDGHFEISVDDRELSTFSNCLNEVCNGIHISEFETTLGATMEDVASMLDTLLASLRIARRGDGGAVPVDTMAFVYELWHFKIGTECEPDIDDPIQDGKDIGIYTTEEKAKAAISRLKDQAGFRDWLGGFRIFRAPLDRDGWVDGFISWDDA